MHRLPQSAVRTILRLATFGAALLLCTASVARASTITCGFGGSSDSGPGCTGGFSTGIFNFGPYQFDLTFQNVHGPFDISVTNALTSQSALLQGGRLNNFPGYTCVTLDGVNCVDFQVTAASPGPTTWTGSYDVTIDWLFDTNSMFPNGSTNRIRILHNRGDVPGNGFDTDVTILGSYVAGGECISHDRDHDRDDCDDDPGITGTDDNFQSLLVAQAPATPVPEPASLALVGLGLATIVRRRRA